MQALALQPKFRYSPNSMKLAILHPALRKKAHPTDGVEPHYLSRWPRLDSSRSTRKRRNCCHLSSTQSREYKGDSHCHCLHLQLIITSTSKAVACAVISTAGNVTTRPTAQTTTSARALVLPTPSGGGNRQADNAAATNEIRRKNRRKIKGLRGLLMILVSFICCRHQPDSSRLTVESKGKPRPAPSPDLPFSLHDLKPTGRASFIRYITDPSWYSKDHV